jgi:hypothetical protein
MSEKSQFEVKNPFTVRLTAEEHQIFQESVIDIMPDAEPEDINNRKLLVRLIDLAISKGKKIFVQRPEDLATIQNLTNEIGRLKIMADLQAEESQKPTDPVLSENQFIIDIPPIVVKLLEIEAETAKRKSGKNFSIEEILLNSFYDSIVFGRVSPFRQWSSAELSQLKKQLQA